MGEAFERVKVRYISPNTEYETGAKTKWGNELILYAQTTRDIHDVMEKGFEKICKKRKGKFAQIDYIEEECGKFITNFQEKSKYIRLVQYIQRQYNLEIGFRGNCQIFIAHEYDEKEDLITWIVSKFNESRHKYLTEDEVFMNDIIYEVNSKRGAPMGRSDVGVRPNWKPIVVRKVELVYDGVYDRGGAYWGSPNNLWVEFTMDLQYIHFYRKEN